jgi:hypothetical protein
MNVLVESPFYQQILEEGAKKGRQEGRQEGRVEGRQEGLIEAVIRVAIRCGGQKSLSESGTLPRSRGSPPGAGSDSCRTNHGGYRSTFLLIKPAGNFFRFTYLVRSDR